MGCIYTVYIDIYLSICLFIYLLLAVVAYIYFPLHCTYFAGFLDRNLAS